MSLINTVHDWHLSIPPETSGFLLPGVMQGDQWINNGPVYQVNNNHICPFPFGSILQILCVLSQNKLYRLLFSYF